MMQYWDYMLWRNISKKCGGAIQLMNKMMVTLFHMMNIVVVVMNKNYNADGTILHIQ